ncbi:MAG: alpha/beta hydrolase [Candidatus Omnitrophica bacterium]|nr:alpha/beta hydrolase [Candidatus Omnitrophota bacterium]MDD5236989.1 alpha/beta hydrolase [Candidatus Omnitrophota bacterium]MDD5609912.1 alpha/beta hydrolase [Candidatus Omnitrophota bacterium]
MIARITLYIAIGFVLLLGYIKFLERKSVFFPLKTVKMTPASLHIPFEDVYLKTEDNVKINAWFIPAKDAKYTLLYFHGNAGNLQDRLEKISIFKDLGLNTFIIDYRGFGKSGGSPSEEGVYRDALAAYDYLINTRKIKDSGIILFGESIGSAVAVDLAAKTKVRALILEGSFSRGKDIAKEIYPMLPAFFFSNIFDSVTKIKKISCPKLFMHSKDDEVVPLRLAQKLYDAAPGPKKMVELRGEHNDAFLASGNVFTSSIALFIRELN